MKEIIGETAGKIWEILGREGCISITKLSRLLKRKNSAIHQALGWLAREDKINFETRGTNIYISLTPSEIEKYTEAAGRS